VVFGLLRTKNIGARFVYAEFGVDTSLCCSLEETKDILSVPMLVFLLGGLLAFRCFLSIVFVDGFMNFCVRGIDSQIVTVDRCRSRWWRCI